VDVHIADSLAGLCVDELRGAESIGDIGAGAGFPGLALAAALARARVDLIEASQRKAAVIDRLAGAGGLSNARTIAQRAEEWAAGDGREAYGAVTARAVAPLAVLVEYAAPLLAAGGVLVAWKGHRDADEEAAGAAAAGQLGLGAPEVVPVTPYPGSKNRHLHVYRKSSPTPEGFPRRPGVASKRPLG
jgi:16S rRNA (guanine527-N7)-methyltransferase